MKSHLEKLEFLKGTTGMPEQYALKCTEFSNNLLGKNLHYKQTTLDYILKLQNNSDYSDGGGVIQDPYFQAIITETFPDKGPVLEELFEFVFLLQGEGSEISSPLNLNAHS